MSTARTDAATGLLRLATLAAVVGCICWLSAALTRGDDGVSAIWLSNGLVLALLLKANPARWPAWLMAALLGNLAANALTQPTLLLGTGLALCNTLEVTLAAWLLRRTAGEQLDLSSGRDLGWFLLVGLLLAPALAAAGGATLLALHLGLDGSTALHDIFGVWFAADAMGLLIVTPLMLALQDEGDVPSARWQWRATLLPWLLLLASTLLVFGQSRYPLLFLVFPPLLLLTYRQGLRGTMLGLASITLIALLATTHGVGPFMLIDTHSLQHRVLLLQVFIAVAAAQGLVVSALLTQKQKLAAALSRSEQTLRTVTDSLPALIAHVDAEERYRFVNAHIGKVFGGDPKAMLGRTMREVRGEVVYADIGPHVKKALAGETVVFESYALVQGRPYFYQSTYVPERAADGAVTGIFAMTFDITERKNAELRQAADEERLRTITDNVPALICYFDHRGIYRFCNQTHEDWFGLPVHEWLGHDYRQVMSEANADAQTPHIYKALSGVRVDTEMTLNIQGQPRTLSGSYIPHLAPDGRVLGVYKLLHDISHLKAAQDELHHLARHDALTSLANRRAFQETLATTVQRNHRQGRHHALMFIDIDHFKAINDEHGHAGGDAVLQALAQRLQAVTRQTDTVARLAGDEFVVLLDGLQKADEAHFIARKIMTAIEQPVLFQSARIVMGLSIGIAFDGTAALSPEDLLGAADRAMYEAKSAGRNTYRVIDLKPEAQDSGRSAGEVPQAGSAL